MKDWINKLTKLGAICLYVALISCVIGVAITLVYAITENNNLPIYGFLYAYCAFLVNAFLLIILTFSIIFIQKNKKKELPILGIMLLNIPIAALCLAIGGYFMDTVKLTLHNETGKILTEVKISGCSEAEIGNLKIGQSKTVRVHNGCQCSIVLHYKKEAQAHSKTIDTYPCMRHKPFGFVID